jgi:hypothetical protein
VVVQRHGVIHHKLVIPLWGAFEEELGRQQEITVVHPATGGRYLLVLAKCNDHEAPVQVTGSVVWPLCSHNVTGSGSNSPPPSSPYLRDVLRSNGDGTMVEGNGIFRDTTVHGVVPDEDGVSTSYQISDTAHRLFSCIPYRLDYWRTTMHIGRPQSLKERIGGRLFPKTHSDDISREPFGRGKPL